MNPFAWCWTAWLLIWLAAAFHNKRTARRENGGSRIVHMLPLLIAGALLVADWTPWPFLQREVLPYRAAFYWIGLALTFGGLAGTVWARLRLGTNWSGSVQVKADHALVRIGPYRWVRHPIYTGLLAALLGTAIALDQWLGLLAFVIVLPGLFYKLRLEERWMIETFGDEYRDYRKHSKALIPGIL
jgi:protein-S-isoprenylcysteine O-methyltransferase Ste14